MARIAVVGGGPGGLFLAALARKADPSTEVTVFERNRADETFGFGVVFSDRTLAGIHDADPVLREALDVSGVHWDVIEVRLRGERIRCGGNGMAAIARRTLLSLMQRRARELGADLRFRTEVGLADLDGYDLVVAADGTGSRIREALEPRFGSTVQTAAAKFVWFGTDYPFDGLTFVHERGPHGVFAVHGYPIGGGVSTFIVETDEASWRAAGLDEFDAAQPPGRSDEKTRGYLEELFADRIDGHRLLVNNSRWGNFRTRRTARWHVLDPRPVALLGDAAHTAHFSVGSGTKMAMEDAVALSRALAEHPGDLGAALAAYETAARPSVERIQGAARPSLSWWEHVGRYHDGFEPWQFAYHFFSRSITDARLARRDPGFVATAHDAWRGRHGAAPLDTPLRVGATTLPGRLLAAVPGAVARVAAPADESGLPAVFARVAELVAGGAELVAVHGGAASTRTLVCEQVRLGHGRAALLVDPDLDRDAALTAVLSGRADAVVGHGKRGSMITPVSAGVVPWPDHVARCYVEAGYWQRRPLGALLGEVADRTPDALALVDGEVRLTHRELHERAGAAAARLVDLGLAVGDRIVVQLPNAWEFVVLTLACLRVGIVPVMALPAHRRTELAHLAAHAEAAAIAVPDRLRDFDHQALAAELAAEVEPLEHVLVAGADVAEGHLDLRELCEPGRPWGGPEPGSRDVAVFLLSGGTTGLPKLIARTHDDYAYNARASARLCELDADTVYLVSLPAGHNFPLACPGILGTLLTGGRVVMLPSPEPARAFATIAAEGVTHTAVVPAVAGRWLEHGAEHGPPTGLRVLQVGGARLADELARKIRPVLGARLQQVFGMAEGLLNYTRLDDPAEVVCHTQGRPLSPADEVRLVDELDRDVPDGHPGSLLTRGPYTPRGYYRAPEQNARAFTADGWYRSGDVCRRTPEGNLVVCGRDKDMINRGGEKISAEEVENLVYQLPAVSQVAAVAMPDAALGERVCVYVVPRPGTCVTLEAVRAAMDAEGVARFKLPERLVVVDELPTTTVGKIDKKALRADVAARLGGAR